MDPTVKDYVKSVSRAQFMLVLHTELGEADVLANLIDSDGNPEILGTVAGADTLLVICKDAVVAEKLESEFHNGIVILSTFGISAGAKFDIFGRWVL